MTNVVNTLTLIDETARVGKVQPTIVLTFIGVNWRTTPAFVAGFKATGSPKEASEAHR